MASSRWLTFCALAGALGACRVYDPALVQQRDGGGGDVATVDGEALDGDEVDGEALDGDPQAEAGDARGDGPSGDGACDGGRCGASCVDLQTDVAHCGMCGRDCRALPGVRADAVRCVAGACELRDACAVGRADCDPMMPGCETMVNTMDQCGACRVRCAEPTPMCTLMMPAGMSGEDPGRDGGVDAGAGASDAGADAGEGGVAAPQAFYACSNGCSTMTPDRCGGQCVSRMTDVANCGACGNACGSQANARPACAMGRCDITCNDGFGNCDGASGNGCETPLATAVMHCGTCGNACATRPNSTPTCAMGTCGLSCNGGFGNCNGMDDDGCETNLATSVMHCGMCGNACPAPENGTASCSMMGGMPTCAVACNAGFTLQDGACVGQPLRLVAPLSTSIVTRPNPTLRWALGGGADGARVEICRDRACTMLVTGLDAPGDRVAVTGSPLPPGVYYWRVRGRRGSASMFVTGVSATWQFEVPRRFGSLPPDSAYPGRLDVNLDGFSDLVVGAYGASLGMSPTGRAFVFLGNSGGLPPSPNTSITPPSGNDVFGRFVAALGDVNGDGFGDVGVVSFAASRVLVYHGSPTGIGTAPATTLMPPSGAVAFGSSLAGVGDVNGDGYGDIVVGAPASATAHVFFGSATGLRTTPSIRLAGNTSSQFGRSVAGPGDVNGDGFADVVVGAPAESFVYAFLSAAPNAITSTTPPVILMGDGQAGDSMAAAGDVNADGYPDIIVAQPGNQTARVWRGGSTGFEMSPPPPVTAPAGATGFGGSVAGGSDVDGDGYADVVIGAPTAARAYVYRGGAFGVASSPNPTLIGSAGSGFGIAVAAPADLDRNTPNFTGEIVVGINSPPSIRVFRGMPPTIFPASDTSVSAPFVFSAPAANFGGALGY